MILSTHGIVGSQIQSFVGLLDTYPNAAAAYSVRKLRAAYTGSAIRVRRSSDNTESDIGFNGFNLDTTSLTSFCGSGNGFVTTWYDQSGNARNATQTTAANQPQIVSSGSVLLKNSKPALDFDGVNDSLIYGSNFMGGSAASVFSVSSFNVVSSGNREIIYGMQDSSGARYDFVLVKQDSPANQLDLYIEGSYNASYQTISDTNQHIFASMYNNGIRRDVYNNGSLFFSITNYSLGLLDDGTSFMIGSDIANLYYIDGLIQEIITWNSDQNSNISGINTNINSFYSIY